MKKIYIIFISLGLLIGNLQGCSYDGFNKGAYNTVQHNQRQKCDRLFGTQRNDCLARLLPSYEKYKKQTNPNKSENKPKWNKS